MGKKIMPPPPEILRKSGPQKDRSKYDRKRVKQDDRREDAPPSRQPDKD